jgi:hypothetical protein
MKINRKEMMKKLKVESYRRVRQLQSSDPVCAIQQSKKGTSMI